ncbi:MAG: NPCBM/NEW2 domain-containing protein, partial [Acidobacteria bacterium]|nr:NPCBM/NEW2 domain-containing protein [Acidobacteriota bacterium]
MKKLGVCCLALTLPMTLIAADRDVNRDGWVNQADVTALARMVAGLDAVDLRYDQDGDNVLTLEDVNHLLDAIPPEAGPGAGTPAAIQGPASPQSGGGMAFYALRQKNSGQCAVVAGGEGISPGDTVYGVFPSFSEAQDLLTNRCNQGAASVTSTTIPTGLPLSNDRLYRPDETITRGKWGTATHINEDANLKNKVNERGLVVEDGFFVAPGHGGDTEILWSHDGSDLMFSGVATVIDCIDYCGGAGSIEFFIRGDGRNLWAGGLVRQGDPGRTFSVSLDGIREVRLVI